MKDLTCTERLLLSALSKDSRASVTTLSKELGVSRATVQSSLNKLTSAQVIRRFTIDVDPEAKADTINAITMITVKGNLTTSVVKALRKMTGVTAVHSTNGSWDLVVEIETISLPAFDQLLRQIRELSGIQNSETSLLLNTLI